LPVYIVGLTDEDFLERTIAEEKVRRTVAKSLKIHPNINEVRIKVKKQSSGGERIRYQLTARALGPSTSFQARHEGWGLMESIDGLCDILDKTLRRAKNEPQKGPRRGRKRRNPQL
jgi:ribosome-associated translation inhibitor RaiA